MAALPSFEAFEDNFIQSKTQAVWTWIQADLETPVSAFLKLTEDQPYSFLLESVEGGEVLGRYSAIGLKPDTIWSYKDGDVFVNDKKQDTQDALASLRAHIKATKLDVMDPDLPPMAPSGLFGYLGYDQIRLIEDIPDNNPDSLDIPETILVHPTIMVIFDNVKNRLCVSLPILQTHKNAEDAKSVYDRACQTIQGILSKLSANHAALDIKNTTKQNLPLSIESNILEDDFHSMVKKAIEYIHAGDIFQVVLSQRFSVPFDLPAFQLYRTLRQLNPSPFLFYFNYGDFQLVGSSPEILVRVRENTVTIRPIAGTRKRGQTPEEDNALKEELLADPKERAEHLMLLDLGRNDVGRVAKTGTVNVTDKFMVENYSHVMHIVSNVEGQLREDMDVLDALFAGFPAGTVSGAPKIRAMEIIDELEPTRRSYYAGSVGYIDGHGNIDTCIALRTGLVKDEQLYVQAGGGVVADSTADFEYQESCNKAHALIQAAEQAIEAAQD